MLKNKSILTELGIYLVHKLKAELIYQKHQGGMKLYKSISSYVQEYLDGVKVEGTMLFYGQYVARGRKARIKRVPIFALKEWIEQQGIADEPESTSVAFAIQEKIFQQGIPTRGSRALAPRRLDFVEEALDQSEAEIRRRVFEFAEQEIETIVTDMVRENNKLLNIQRA